MTKARRQIHGCATADQRRVVTVASSETVVSTRHRFACTTTGHPMMNNDTMQPGRRIILYSGKFDLFRGLEPAWNGRPRHTIRVGSGPIESKKTKSRSRHLTHCQSSEVLANVYWFLISLRTSKVTSQICFAHPWCRIRKHFC